VSARAPKPQAYELQEQGVEDAWKAMGVDRFSVCAFSICPK